ncbi:DUF2318 domain-containing protein [Patescibacteria group bacterium]|nr:DUF2318 domain-containing protein [Patescibacteria group bacterium]
MSKDEFRVNKQAIIAVFLCLVIAGLAFANRRMDSRNKNENPVVTKGDQPTAIERRSFLGDEGEMLQAEGDKVYIDQSRVDGGNMHAFNYYSEKKKKTIYFFIVKASDDTYRVAANACEVCFDSLKGFKQIGNQIRCENCRVTYSKDQIALQKGGCNPRPIDKDAEIIDGQLVINIADIEKTADLF